MRQCHLAVPVRAGQELPRRRQAAHPRRGGATLLGISTLACAASAISSSSIAVGGGAGLCSVSAAASAPSSA